MYLGIIKNTYNRTAQPRCYHNAFYERPFHEPRRGGNSDLLWQSGASESATVCFVISLSICYWLFKCGVLSVVCVCVCVCVGERETPRLVCKHIRASSLCLSHDSVPIPFGAWTDGKIKDIINCLYIYFERWSSRCYISDSCLRCSANHNALCQLANQSRLRLSEGGTL